MNIKTGDIHTEAALRELFDKTYEEQPPAEFNELARKLGHTPLTPEELAQIEPRNRQERRALLAKLRRAARDAKGQP